MKALIFENKIVDTSEVEFEVHSSMTWMDCPDECKDGLCVLENGVPVVVAVDNTVPALTYSDYRKEEYDKLPQFEMQFDDNRDGTSTWVDSINAIKVRFPK